MENHAKEIVDHAKEIIMNYEEKESKKLDKNMENYAKNTY